MSLQVAPDKTKAEQKDIHRVCFVCTGNTCRSPMAAALYNHIHQKDAATATSAGIAAVPGEPIAENAVLALRNFGITPTSKNDYEAHLATPLTEDMMSLCDTVYALSSRHYMAICLAFPEHIDKIRLLGEIADPYGSDLDTYEQTLEQIKEALHE